MNQATHRISLRPCSASSVNVQFFFHRPKKKKPPQKERESLKTNVANVHNLIDAERIITTYEHTRTETIPIDKVSSSDYGG